MKYILLPPLYLVFCIIHFIISLISGTAQFLWTFNKYAFLYAIEVNVSYDTGNIILDTAWNYHHYTKPTALHAFWDRMRCLYNI